ncbi:MAG: PEGA domain-containing protein [Verrucomicrobiota bacterium]|jgi:hypothetical protein
MEKSGISEKRGRQQLRILRPLLWWLILVLVLFAIHTHERLMEKTRLIFKVTLEGQAVDAAATLDGKPAMSGQNISLGSHVFAVTHPKGEPFSTNLSIWYGAHDLVTIDLKRAKGTLAVSAYPPAPFLSIRGPEWSVTLTNSSGLTETVPTDQYTVESRYAHWGRSDEVTVNAGLTATWRIAPQLGAVQLSCNQSNATFQLLTLDGRRVETGEFPFLIAELPEGSYKLNSQHHGHERDQTLPVKAGATNDNRVEFQYGAAVLETEPAGAAVEDGNGRYWGVTPLNLPELLPGTLQLTLHRAGYEAVPVSLEITADQTATFRTNLVSTGYTGAMKSARQYMDAADYSRALQAVGDALVAKPGDAQAIALQREATGLGQVQHAKTLGAMGDYIDGDKELELALQALPDNGEIKQLIAEYKQHEPEQIERLRVERLNRPKQVFNELLGKYQDADLFDEHELTTGKPAKEAAAAIANALLYTQPAFKIDVNDSPKPETYEIVGMQDVSGILSVSGQRRCIIVCGQATDTNTEILYKVMEYEAKHNVSMPGLLAFKDEVQYIPIHPSTITNMTDKLKAQLQAGVSNLTVRIQGAVGQ